jgi:hypothetical protein
VPVAEYRPDSSAIVYRVDPESMTAEEAFRFGDHLGGIVADPEDGTMVAVSWGSRTLYRFNERGILDSSVPNESHFIDYQDCQHAGGSQMLCGGITEFPVGEEATFPLGGLALVDMDTLTVGHEVPVTQRSAAGSVVTRNPVLLEATDSGLRLSAVPDDDEAGTLLILEADVE